MSLTTYGMDTDYDGFLGILPKGVWGIIGEVVDASQSAVRSKKRTRLFSDELKCDVYSFWIAWHNEYPKYIIEFRHYLIDLE